MRLYHAHSLDYEYIKHNWSSFLSFSFGSLKKNIFFVFNTEFYENTSFLLWFETINTKE